ncbi:MAG: DinB family protein [Pirellulaceae bacterium]|nr:DinB family protein [Pirellulaceae bacterium]
MQIELYRDLESFHAWSMHKVFELCGRVDPVKLQAVYPMVYGSALQILATCASTERFWFDLCTKTSRESMWDPPETLDGLKSFLLSIANERREWVENHSDSLSTVIEYRNVHGRYFHKRLGDILLNSFNTAVGLRALLLYVLKQCGQTAVGGLDYIFYRLSAPTIPLQAEVAESYRQWGLEVGQSVTPSQAADLNSLIDFAEYGDWATQVLCNQALYLTDEALDRDWGIGPGTIRKTFLHLYDSERFWQANWDGPGSAFDHSNASTTITEVVAKWSKMADIRKRKTIQMQGQLDSSVCVDFGSGPLEFRFSESLLQLAVHGTHHRTQLHYMLCQSGRPPQAIDYVDWAHA